jgi:hypothetical protein
VPFYVGKGSKGRIYDHEQEAKLGHRCHKCNVIRKVWKSGGDIHRYIVFTTDNEQEAFDFERETIALYGRDTLTNVTDGGEGVSGWIPTPEETARKSAATRARYLDPAERAKTAASVRARYANPEERARTSERMKRALASPEARARISANLHKRYADPVEREFARQNAQAQWANPVERAKRLAKAADPEVRAKQSASARIQRADPEYRARQSAAAKAAWKRRKARERGNTDE